MSAIEWRTAEVFTNRGMAEVGGSALRSAGIPHRVLADDVQSIGLPLGLHHGGARLQVPTEQLEEAQVLLGVEEGLEVDADLSSDDAWPGAGIVLRVAAAAVLIALVLSILLSR